MKRLLCSLLFFATISFAQLTPLTAIGRLQTAISAAGNVSAQMRAIGKLAAGINASAFITAMLGGIGPISASIVASAAVTGTLMDAAGNLLRVKNTYATPLVPDFSAAPLVPALTATCLNADNSAKEIVNGT